MKRRVVDQGVGPATSWSPRRRRAPGPSGAARGPRGPARRPTRRRCWARPGRDRERRAPSAAPARRTPPRAPGRQDPSRRRPRPPRRPRRPGRPRSPLLPRAPPRRAPADGVATQRVAQRGQRPPGWRSSMRSPVCEPPRAVSSGTTVAMASCRRLASGSDSRSAGRWGAMRARHRISSARRLPIPAMRDWSMIRAFSAAELPASAARSSASVRPRASGPRLPSSGSSDTPPQPSRVAEGQRAATLEAEREPHEARVLPVGAVQQLVDRRLPVHQQATGHCRSAARGRCPRRGRASSASRGGGRPPPSRPGARRSPPRACSPSGTMRRGPTPRRSCARRTVRRPGGRSPPR